MLFTVIYSLIFYIATKHLLLFFPFLLGALMYLPTKRLSLDLRRKLHLSEKLSHIISTAICYIMMLVIIVGIIALIVTDIVILIRKADILDASKLPEEALELIAAIERNIRGALSKTQNETLLSISTWGTAAKSLLVTSGILFSYVMSYAFTVFLLQNSHKVFRLVTNIIRADMVSALLKAIRSNAKTSLGLMFSYLIIYLITFSESGIIFGILNIEYPWLTALLVTIMDVMPVFGPGIVMLPLAVYKLICGHHIQFIGIIVGFAIISVIRQLIEPRLIAKNSHIPSLVMFTAVYVMLITGRSAVIPYVMLFHYTLHIFKDAGIIAAVDKKST